MMAVAIDQIFRLAPSISGPIEPVVSSTNATSTMGLGCFAPNSGGSDEAVAAVTRLKVNARPIAKVAGSNARETIENMMSPS